MDTRPSELPYAEFYRILISSVAPRPIAWVSTMDREGRLNLAPFSFFNAISGRPPLLVVSPGLRRLPAAADGAAPHAPSVQEPSFQEPGFQEPGFQEKDTLRNIRETKEFVVNVVTYDLAQAMNVTSGEYDPSVNEFELARLTPRPSKLVRPPAVADSPVNFECKLRQILDFADPPYGNSLVIGEIVSVHVKEAHLKDGRLDPDSLDLIGRMGGNQYSRTAQRFEMVRPKAPRP